jgi:hypothetical protein
MISRSFLSLSVWQMRPASANSDATREVGRLERCLDTVGVALTASERETAAAQAATTNAQAPIVGKGSLRLVVMSVVHSF